MIYSMTAYARSEVKEPWGTCIWELRSVNQRYLECHFRLPEMQRALEPTLREKIRQKLQRGKIEINLRIQNSQREDQQLILNQALADQIITASQHLASQLDHQSGSIDPMDILRWPGVMNTTEQDQSDLQKCLLKHVDTLIEDFLAARQREGRAMADVIRDKLDQIESHVAFVTSKMTTVLQWQREKLTHKLNELQQDLDPNRLEQELLYVAQKTDVAEEMERLQAHITETRRILKKGGACGRRLDFMMQEFNRESNTLASKSIDAEITNTAIELKVLIEQMREQIQNIE